MTGTAQTLEPVLTTRSFRAIGTTATVVVQEPDGPAWPSGSRRPSSRRSTWRAAGSAMTPSCRRSTRGGAGRRVSSAALRSARRWPRWPQRTHGAVDPTVGNAIAGSGTTATSTRSGPTPGPPRPSARWLAHARAAEPRQRTVRIPRGVRLDLGSTAKALAADRPRPHRPRSRCGGTRNLGGDVAVAGLAPVGGWPVGIALESSTPVDEVDQVVAITTVGWPARPSSVRTWTAGHGRAPHRRSPHRGLRRALLGPGVGDRCQLRGGQPRDHRLARLGRAGARELAGSTSRSGWCDSMDKVFTVERLAAGGVGVSSTAFWYATRASGIVALVLLTLTMVLGIATTSRARRPDGRASPNRRCIAAFP